MPTAEWELDEWEFRGGITRNLELDAEDFEGMSDEAIRDEIYSRVQDAGRDLARFVVPNLDEVVQEIRGELDGAELEEAA